MKIFCTLSDINYLAMGIALYKSLKEHSKEEFTLYYLCLDKETEEILLNLNYNEVKTIPLSLIEEEKELKEAKENRPYNEYCWTLASYFTLWVMDNKPVKNVSYIDSDIFFYQDPEIIYKEINDKPVGIIAHRHNCVGNTDGAYNVGIIYFNNTEKGKEVLTWWKDAVLHKKYPEYHGCGDQKYLEGFIPNFGEENICVADKTFGHGAPWNFRLYVYDKFEKENKIIWGDKEQPFIFNHFSRLKYDLETDQVAPTGGQYMDHTLGLFVFNIPTVNLLYRNYYVLLKDIHQTILSKPIEAPNIRGPQLKMAVGMILFEGEYVLKQSLESIYPFASQIMISEGPVKFWQNCGRETSSDRSNEIIDNFPDPENKLNIVHGKFNEKDDQCKAYMPFLKDDADYIWNIDSDEVYKPEDIEKIIQVLYDKKYTSVGVRPVSFYGSFDNYITGWEEEKDQFLRIFKVYPGSTWKTHRPPTIKHSVQPILADNHLDSERLFHDYGVRMFHYSYVYPLQVYNKITYYKAAVSRHKCIDDYFEKVYLPWVTGDELDKDMIEQAYKGVHEWKPEYRSETMTARFEGTHPPAITNSLNELKTLFDFQINRMLEVKETMKISDIEFQKKFKEWNKHVQS